MKAADSLERDGAVVEVIDCRTLKPIDEATILESAKKTGRLVVADIAWKTGRVSAEIAAPVSEKASHHLRRPIKRISLPDCPTPTSRGLIKFYYPRAKQIMEAIQDMLNLERTNELELPDESVLYDVPDKYFTGPF